VLVLQQYDDRRFVNLGKPRPSGEQPQGKRATEVPDMTLQIGSASHCTARPSRGRAAVTGSRGAGHPKQYGLQWEGSGSTERWEKETGPPVEAGAPLSLCWVLRLRGHVTSPSPWNHSRISVGACRMRKPSPMISLISGVASSSADSLSSDRKQPLPFGAPDRLIG
jgi:hypothetical protein